MMSFQKYFAPRLLQVKETPRSKRKSTIVISRPGASSMLVVALLPVMEEVGDSKKSLKFKEFFLRLEGKIAYSQGIKAIGQCLGR